MSIQRGSIILYKSSGKWYERAISLATRGPFVHAAIAIEPTRIVEATPHGIVISPAPININTFTAIDIFPYTTQGKIDEALVWAVQQRGDDYGWSDIVYQAIKFMWPSNPLRWGIAGHMDCSDFVTRYLLHAEVPLPDQFMDPYANSPCDIARAFNLLPPRKGAA